MRPFFMSFSGFEDEESLIEPIPHVLPLYYYLFKRSLLFCFFLLLLLLDPQSISM